MIDDAHKVNEPYDVLLLDLRMPILDGFSVVEHLNRRKYDIPKIAVVTASVLDQDRERCKKLGVKYFILKPINISQIRNILTAMFKN